MVSIIDSFRLDGRVALVTGAGKGIGEGIALGMAEAGADVALVARTAADLERVATTIRRLGRQALVVPADLAQVETLPDVVTRVLAAYPRIDILVNVAGMQRRMTVLEATVAGWQQVLDTNLRSA
ncbi:MAG: SDR family NAD(P)-dependent oxidoreductase [Acidobacteria bacterium]|nr:MAG: SDR family NAD(P)-dependent oxidoreductase [Acidobacteriota bacterium]